MSAFVGTPVAEPAIMQPSDSPGRWRDQTTLLFWGIDDECHLWSVAEHARPPQSKTRLRQVLAGTGDRASGDQRAERRQRQIRRVRCVLTNAASD